MKIFITALVSNIVLFPSFVVAATGSICNSGGSGLCNPLKATSIQGLLVAILGYVVQIGIVFIVLMLVFTGFKFAAAQGKPEELQKVRSMFLWTIVGALVILGAQAIATGVSSTITAISTTP